MQGVPGQGGPDDGLAPAGRQGHHLDGGRVVGGRRQGGPDGLGLVGVEHEGPVLPELDEHHVNPHAFVLQPAGGLVGGGLHDRERPRGTQGSALAADLGSLGAVLAVVVTTPPDWPIMDGRKAEGGTAMRAIPLARTVP